MKGKEIYNSILEYADKDGHHELDDVEFVSVDKIVQMAFRFECCPSCGNVDADSHFCDKCEEGLKGFTELDDAYWFSQFLIKEFGLKDYPCHMK